MRDPLELPLPPKPPTAEENIEALLRFLHSVDTALSDVREHLDGALGSVPGEKSSALIETVIYRHLKRPGKDFVEFTRQDMDATGTIRGFLTALLHDVDMYGNSLRRLHDSLALELREFKSKQ